MRECNLLFLDDFGHRVKKLELFGSFVLLSLPEEYVSASVASVDSLNVATGVENLLVVPLNFEHAPVLLNVDGCQLLFLSVLLCLTTGMRVKKRGWE